MASLDDTTNTLLADESRQGAAALARSADHNARLIIVRLMKDHHPKKSKDSLYKMFNAETEGDSDFDDVFRFYYFTNMYQAELRLLSKPQPKPKPTPKESRAARTTRAAAIKAKILDVLTLDFIMPSGIRLRDCTGAQCIEAGGQFTAIGEKVGPKRKVGAVIRDDRALAAVLQTPADNRIAAP